VFEEGKSWAEVSDALHDRFPDKTWWQVRNKVRDYIRSTPEYAERHKPNSDIPDKSSIEYCQDGTIVSEKFIILKDGTDMTPERILEAHGLKVSEWEVISYKNNFWNSQVAGGVKQISYQSKLTARPKRKGLDFSEIDKHFAELERKRFVPPVIKPMLGDLMAEVNIADLHLGKLCWHGDTPENYDYKIAKEVFFKIIGEAVEELRGKPIEYITFVWTNDFFNSDTIDKTTTAGTRQDTDVRWQKLFNVGVEMLVRAVEQLSEISPVKIFYTRSNHDEVNGYMALKYLEAWFRNDPNVSVNIDAYPRKYQLYGNTLIGYCHGDKEESRGTKEKASRLASLMPIEAASLWGQAKYREMHAAHLHGEQMIQEINGVIVRRISSPTAADTYHTERGYLGNVRKAQVFIYDKERGLKQVINIPVQ